MVFRDRQDRGERRRGRVSARGASLLETLVAAGVVAILAAIALDCGLDTIERVQALVGDL